MEKIGVVTITYNSEHVLDDFLDSIFNQTYSNFYLYIIDNSSKDDTNRILLDIAENRGPNKSLIILGYSGWGGGQLEGEMEKDHWILSDIDLNIIFDEESKKKWNKAYKNSFVKI